MKPQHGVANWRLESYDWEESTGVAVLEYSRRVAGVTEPEVVIVTVNHPTLPHHEGWVVN